MISQIERQQRYEQAVFTLATRLRGKLILPEEADFDAARQVWNGTYDCRPALIVRCADVDDVIASVIFAREQEMDVSVRSGGHSMVGYGTNDGGLIIDLSNMKAFSVDPEQRIAYLEPGLTWSEVANELQPYGLALTSGDTATVGVGGLLLGGGIGWMARKYGLALDHVRAVELVTADGEFLRASADNHSELFWGLLGGGGNFGIATAFEVDVHPAGTILGGAIVYDAAEAERILRGYAYHAAAAPDELTTQAMLVIAPPLPVIPADKQGMPVVVILVCYTGDLAEGEQAVAPLRALGVPIAEVLAPMPYPAFLSFNQMGEIRGLQHHVRSAFFQTLSDDLLHALVEAFRASMSTETLVQLRVLGGAMSRVAADATAFAHRDKQGLVLVNHLGPTFADPAMLAGRTQHIWQALQPYADGVYVNFLADEGQQRIHEAYPPATYARLAALKRRYDPTNLFRRNQNIKPANR